MFKELSDFKQTLDGNNHSLTCQYKRNIEFSRGTKRIYVNEDRFIFLDKAKKKNSNYVFYQSPFIKDKYLKELKQLNEKLNIKYLKTPENYDLINNIDFTFSENIDDLIVDVIIEIFKSDDNNLKAVDVVKMFEKWEETEIQKENGIFSNLLFNIKH